MSAGILIVDDDRDLSSMLAEFLGHEGFQVATIEEGGGALGLIAERPFDLVILDVMLPGSSGFDVLREIRQRKPRLPVLMLTARGEAIDRILGLELGADDYLPKPFNPRELLARIHAVLRRQTTTPPGAPQVDEPAVRFGNVEVDFAARALKRGDELLTLTTGEFAVLKVLLQHPRQPLSRDKLMALARGREQGPFDRAIDVQISRLRKLIES